MNGNEWANVARLALVLSYAAYIIHELLRLG